METRGFRKLERVRTDVGEGVVLVSGGGTCGGPGDVPGDRRCSTFTGLLGAWISIAAKGCL